MNNNSLNTTNFKFVISRLPGVTFWLQSCQLPSKSTGSASMPHPYAGTIPIPGQERIYDPLNITFIVDNNLDNWFELSNWMDSYQSDLDLSELWSDASLIIMSPDGTVRRDVRFTHMFPDSIAELNFASDVSTDDIIVGSATLKYTTYK